MVFRICWKLVFQQRKGHTKNDNGLSSNVLKYMHPQTIWNILEKYTQALRIDLNMALSKWKHKTLAMFSEVNGCNLLKTLQLNVAACGN